MCGRQEIEDAELAIMDKKFLKNALMAKLISAVSHHLPDTLHNKMLSYDIGPMDSLLNVLCIYRLAGKNSLTDSSPFAHKVSLRLYPSTWFCLRSQHQGHILESIVICYSGSPRGPRLLRTQTTEPFQNPLPVLSSKVVILVLFYLHYILLTYIYKISWQTFHACWWSQNSLTF